MIRLDSLVCTVRRSCSFRLGVAAAQEMKPIKIGFQSGEINVILSYALGSGLFKANGLDVKVSPNFRPARRCCPRLQQPRSDLAWMGEFPAVTGYSNGLPIQILFMERIDATNVRLVGKSCRGHRGAGGSQGKTHRRSHRIDKSLPSAPGARRKQT